jgi:hypothetical protein
LEYIPGSLLASSGTAKLENSMISWSGNLAAGAQVSIQFAATVRPEIGIETIVTNTAEIRGAGEVFKRPTKILVDYHKTFLPCAFSPCRPVYADNFSNPTSGWPQVDDSDVSMGYVNGEYVMRIKQPDTWTGAVISGIDPFNGYGVDVDVYSPSAGSADGTYGLLFGVSGTGSYFYDFEIDAHGNYALYYYNDFSGWEMMTKGFTPALKQGAAVNHLKFVRDGYGKGHLYINGTSLGQVDPIAYGFYGDFGLVTFGYGQRNVTAHFDNFAVWNGNCLLEQSRRQPTLTEFKVLRLKGNR